MRRRGMRIGYYWWESGKERVGVFMPFVSPVGADM
jgi:hypothetical protein